MNASRAVRMIADGFSFLEGPRWHDGRLFASDFYTRRVLAFDADGTANVVCEVPGQPSGLGFAPDGSMLIVSMTDRRLLRLAGGRLEVVADLSALAAFHANDMLVDDTGRAYIGNFGWNATADSPIRSACLILVDAQGRASVAADDLVFPNGVVVADAGRTLLVCETFAGRIAAFERAADGSLSRRSTWASFTDASFGNIAAAVASRRPLPDGMAIDAQGAVWIGDAAGNGPLRVAKGGRILERIDTGGLAVFAVALGGPQGRTLFMCASPPLLSNDPATDHRACLLACEVDVPAAGHGNPR
jgi:sugar lactone lactonase YvrE